ncbi:XkdQ/YqbQ family protein [Clostridium tetani]|uniref:YqbQ/XkdQ domain-containing protein n=1 Tax=Clostridium tetani TaxID=1513 RepID=A0ABC8EBQ4_CLOTA|nr:XkdQ [Clostridium tetani]BDR81015.1 hypothetical protein K234311028_12610 [Clostridium tetani]
MADIIFKDKYKIENFNEGIQLSESIDGIAYTVNIDLIEIDEFKKLGLVKASPIQIWDTDYETKKQVLLFKGMAWGVNKSRRDKRVRLICKERTIYLDQSEEEYLFPAGQTATQRAIQYCKDWSIPQGVLAGTSIPLSKAMYRNNTIYDMMKKDLKETAQKGGKLFKFRMSSGKLDIVELGSNKTVWKLESIAEDIEEQSSLDGMVTQVKVLGKQKENKKTPVIGVYKNNLNICKYGAIQKIVQDDKIKNGDEAKKKAVSLFNSGKETVRVSGIDINTIRAGDKVSLDEKLLYVIDVTHNLGSIGKMDLNLGTLEYIRREFFSGD